MKYIPDGPTFEAGDEIVITYSGNADEKDPAVLRGVVKIDLSHGGYGRKYGSESKNVLTEETNL